MARKFIITEEKFVMGNVDFHNQLVGRLAKETKPVLGGGRWFADEDEKVLYLWGQSHDYGFAHPEQIKKALESTETFISPSLHEFKVKHSSVVTDDLPEQSTFVDLLIIDNE